ncbi:RNA polymerase sigma-70 factor [Dyadobacter luticola]|uniref:RNA polymerase sigma-70 factor n=1 Tax=Dyadobacter luticola TaxID=1979387 RepID=A0A5R9L283_9BACT|nr:RNA polymerase sigma-70 factor [Dyadobacter luticola]TLV02531.1 RNA polymerase sigma-70 factor [Dyadobacter luticola]
MSTFSYRNPHEDLPVPAQEKLLDDTLVTDDEFLLRKEFGTNPEKGCELLFRRYYVNLCNHAVRFVHSKEVAEDIVSEIFTVFWQNQTFLHVTTSYRAYLYKSVRHRAYNYLKFQMKFSHSPEDQTKCSDSLNPDEALQFTELHQKIEHIIRELPPQCRRAYILKRVEGKKYHEIAEELKISSKAVEALVSRALIRLRKELSSHWTLLLLLFLY